MDLSEVRIVEEQKVGGLKLSDAIRIGAQMRSLQCHGDYFGGQGSSCALGAAWEGSGRANTPPSAMYETAALLGISNKLVMEIAHRNDHYFHTREQIADWLEAQGL